MDGGDAVAVFRQILLSVWKVFVSPPRTVVAQLRRRAYEHAGRRRDKECVTLGEGGCLRLVYILRPPGSRSERITVEAMPHRRCDVDDDRFDGIPGRIDLPPGIGRSRRWVVRRRRSCRPCCRRWPLASPPFEVELLGRLAIEGNVRTIAVDFNFGKRQCALCQAVQCVHIGPRNLCRWCFRRQAGGQASATARSWCKAGPSSSKSSARARKSRMPALIWSPASTLCRGPSTFINDTPIWRMI